MNSEYRILIKESREIKGGTCIPMCIPACFRPDKSSFFIGEINNFKNLYFNKRLNNYGTCRFDIEVDDVVANAMISLCQYSVYIYRVTTSGDVLVWSGEQRRRTGKVVENHNDWATIYCYDWFYALKDRYTASEVKYKSRYSSGTLNYVTYAFENISGGTDWTYETSYFGNYVGISEKITDYIKFTNFGADIPLNATITGIELSFNNWGDCDYKKDTLVNLIIGGFIQAINIGSNNNILSEVITYGGSSQLFGYTLTPSIVNSSTFGFSLSFTVSNEFISIDNIIKPSIKIYYNVENVINITDSGAIAWDLIETSQLKTNGSLAITKGTIATTQDRSRTYNNQNIMEAIVNLSDVINGFDFEITNDKVFNVYTIKGVDLTSSLILEYGRNLQTVSVDEDFTTPCNSAIVLGEVIDGTELSRVDRPDTATQIKYKLREMVLSADNVIDINTLNEKGDAMLYKYKEPLIKITFEVIRGTIDVTQFSLGDLIRLTIKKGCYNIDSSYRIFEWTVDHENDNTEKLSLVLGELGI